MENLDYSVKIGYFVAASQFRRIFEKLQIDGDKIYQEQGFKFKASWFPIFFKLVYTPCPQPISALAKSVGVSHISIKNVARELAAEDLVHIETHPTDKRSKQLYLTEKGKELATQLAQVWIGYAHALEDLFSDGHPSFLNILARIERKVYKHPLNVQFNKLADLPKIRIVDYQPSLKKFFYELSGRSLLELLKGSLEEEDNFTLHHPDQAYLLSGGFVFFALYNQKTVGCVALKRLSDNTFEFEKLFVNPDLRNQGIATKLIERCITRCQENGAKELWVQTTEPRQIYHRLGFVNKEAPRQMKVSRRTQSIMTLELQG
ncbi:MAG: bifunctional helix-turn-helix transcriptional regulator/GNAT family N-acetyltransferase [Bacteroidia bacterium]